MANTIKHKRGSGSNPSASDLAVGELAIRTDTGVVFTKKDDGTVAEIAGGGETNLGVSTTTTAVTVTSDTGNNATISEASSSAAGVMSAAHHDKLDGIASGATANSTESIQDIVGGMVSGNSESGISVTYQDSDGTLDFSVSSQTDNNFTTTLKNKLDGIESGATADQTKSDIDALGIDADTVDGVEASSFLRSDAADTKTSGDLTFNDSVKAVFGTGSDLEIYHDGSNSFIKDTGTGRLTIATSQLQLTNAADSEVMIKATQDGAAELYHNGTKKLETVSYGIDVTGQVQCDTLNVDGNADIDGTLEVNQLVVRDNGSDSPTLQLRTDDGSPYALQISNDNWSNGTTRGLLFYQENDGTVYQRLMGVSSTFEPYLIQQSDGSTTNTGIELTTSREVKLYYQGNNKLKTKSAGVDITGELECDSLDVDGAANITGNLDIDGDIRHNGDTNCLFGFPAADTFRVTTGGTERFRITSTGAIAIEGSSNYGTSGQVLTSNGNDAPTWQDGGGTVASGCVYENSQTISANYSVTSGKNAMSAGPITIASGVTVTVTSGSTYTIV